MNDFNGYFKVSRRQYIDAALMDFGFKTYKSSYLGRLTNDNVFQFIGFIKYRFGGQFKVVIAIRPLFCPNESYLASQPGNTLDHMATNGKSDRWWLSTDQNIIDLSLKEVSKLINQFALPFFNATTTSEDIIKSNQRNFFGISKFGKRINWGAQGWREFDFGHIYLYSGDTKKAMSLFFKAYKEFKSDNRDWAQESAAKCLIINQIISAGPTEIKKYLGDIIADSKEKLKLIEW